MTNTRKLYNEFKNVLIQIATPWSTGTGFYVNDYNIVVTSFHATRGAREMVISGKLFPKTMARLLYADSANKLAFVEAPEGVLLPKVDLANINLFNENQGFNFSLEYLKKALDKYQQYKGKFVMVCSNCSTFITKENIIDFCCPDCGTKVPIDVFNGKKYKPSPTGKKIEEIIRKLNYEVPIARIGKDFWEIEEGSALICIKHDVDNRYVKAYAVLCKLPKENIGSIYEYLLKENNYLKGLSFSVIKNEILLSMMHISEEDLHINSAIRLFKTLFNKADDYDDILIEMGASPLDSEE